MLAASPDHFDLDQNYDWFLPHLNGELTKRSFNFLDNRHYQRAKYIKQTFNQQAPKWSKRTVMNPRKDAS